jgi:hypothetical protein
MKQQSGDKRNGLKPISFFIQRRFAFLKKSLRVFEKKAAAICIIIFIKSF